MKKIAFLFIIGSFLLSGCSQSDKISDYGEVEDPPKMMERAQVATYPDPKKKPDPSMYLEAIEYIQQINDTTAVLYRVVWGSEAFPDTPHVYATIYKNGYPVYRETSNKNLNDPVHSSAHRLENGEILVVSTLYSDSSPSASGLSRYYLLDPEAGIYEIIKKAESIPLLERSTGDQFSDEILELIEQGRNSSATSSR